MPDYQFGAVVTLMDDHLKRTQLRFTFAPITAVDFATAAGTAESALADLVVDIKAATLANVYAIRLTADDPGADADGVPSVTGADVSDEAAIQCHTDDVLKPGETVILRMPAPVLAFWINDNYEEGLDVSEPIVQNYVANFDTVFTVSDGDSIDLTEGTAGIAGGYWRSRAMSLN